MLVCVHEYLIVSVSLLTGSLFLDLVNLPRFECACVHANMCIKILADWRPTFGSYKFSRILVCVCVCKRACMCVCVCVLVSMRVYVSLLTGDLFLGLVSLQGFVYVCVNAPLK